MREEKMLVPDFNLMEDRVFEVLEDNDEKDFEGVSAELLTEIDYPPCVSLYTLFEFAEEYNVSIDWLLGRSDRYWP